MRWALCVCLALAARGQDSVAARHRAAWVLVGQERNEEAIRALKALISERPQYMPAYETLAWAFWQSSGAADAEKQFRDEQAGNPFAPAASGHLRFKQDDRVGAVQEFRFCAAHSLVCLQRYLEQLPLSTWWAPDAVERVSAGLGIPARDPRRGLAAVAYLAARKRSTEELAEVEKVITWLKANDEGALLGEYYTLRAGLVWELKRDLPAARADDEEALRLAHAAGDSDREFLLERNRGGWERINGNPEQARLICEDQLRHAQALGHLRMQEDVLYALGIFHDSEGAHATALRYYREAASLEKRTPPWRDILYQRIGDDLLRLGKQEEAQVAYEEGLRLSRGRSDRSGQGFLLSALAQLSRDSGDYSRALGYGQESVRQFEAGEYRRQAGAQVGDNALTYAGLGDYPSALRLMKASFDSGHRFSDYGEMMRTSIGQADILLRLGRVEEARGLYRRALDYAPQANYQPFEIQGWMGLAEAQLRARRWSAAEETLDRAESIAGASVLAKARIERLRGEIALGAGNLEGAKKRFEAAVELGDRVAGRRGLAETLMRLGNLRGAWEKLEKAIKELERVRSCTPGPELRMSYLRENARVYEDAIDLLARMGENELALAVAEKARARALVDLLAESKAQVRKGLSTEDLARQRTLAAALSRAVSRKEITQAESALEQWAAEVRVRSPEYQRLQYPEPLDADGIRELARRTQAVILQYALGDRASRLWAVSASSVTMLTLPGRTRIEALVRAVRAEVARPPHGRTEVGEVLKEAYRVLLRNVRGNGRLLIVPDGILYYLPFEALMAPDGRYLVESQAIAYAPSGTAAGMLESGQSRGGRALLAMGDPLYPSRQGGARPEQAVRDIYRDAGFEFAPLPNSRVEVMKIATMFPGSKTMLGLEATETALKGERSSDYRRVHLAAHAVLDEQIPGRSGIVFSVQDPGGEDGILRASEIFNLEMDADLVVLSACKTGLGKTVRGEGMVGLTRAFLYAGARRVVVSLWEVNDLAVPDLMVEFYSGLRERVLAAEALRRAKVAFLKSSILGYRHPYFWASFVVVGGS